MAQPKHGKRSVPSSVSFPPSPAKLAIDNQLAPFGKSGKQDGTGTEPSRPSTDRHTPAGTVDVCRPPSQTAHAGPRRASLLLTRRTQPGGAQLMPRSRCEAPPERRAPGQASSLNTVSRAQIHRCLRGRGTKKRGQTGELRPGPDTHLAAFPTPPATQGSSSGSARAQSCGIFALGLPPPPPREGAASSVLGPSQPRLLPGALLAGGDVKPGTAAGAPRRGAQRLLYA